MNTPVPSDNLYQNEINRSIWHAAMSLGVRIATLTIRLARNIIIARILGPVERGVLATLMALPEIITTIVAGGLHNASAFFGAKSLHGKPYLGVLTTLSVLFGVLTAAAVAIVFTQPALFKGFYDAAKEHQFAVALVSVLFLFKVMYSGYQTAAGRVITYNVLRLSESILPLVGFLALWAAGLDPLRAAVVSWAGAYVAIAAGAVAGSAMRREFGRFADGGMAREVSSYGWRSHLDRTARIIILRADYLFIAAFLGAEAAGYYAIATIGAELCTSVIEAVNVPMTRHLMREGGSRKLTATIAVARLTFVAMTAMALVIGLFAEPAIAFLFGREFTPAAPALIWLLPGVIALGVSSLFRLHLLGMAKPAGVSMIAVISAIIFVLLCLFLIPRLGIVGAAIASSIAYGFRALAFITMSFRIAKAPLSAFLVVDPIEKDFWRELIARIARLRRKRQRQ